MHRDFLYVLCHSFMLNNTPFCICHIPTNYSFLKHLGLRFHFLWFLHATFSANFNIAWAIIIFIRMKYHWVQTLLWNTFFVSHTKFQHKNWIKVSSIIYIERGEFRRFSFLWIYLFDWRNIRKHIPFYSKKQDIEILLNIHYLWQSIPNCILTRQFFSMYTMSSEWKKLQAQMITTELPVTHFDKP